eukprot:4930923-Amphidinium_carterae.1
MTAAPLRHRKDPALRFGFPTGESLRLAEGAPLLRLTNVTFAYPESKQPTLARADLSDMKEKENAVGMRLDTSFQSGL